LSFRYANKLNVSTRVVVVSDTGIHCTPTSTHVIHQRVLKAGHFFNRKCRCHIPYLCISWVFSQHFEKDHVFKRKI